MFTAADLAANWTQLVALLNAGKLASVQIAGSSAAITAADMAKISGLRPTIAAGAQFKVEGSAESLINNLSGLSLATSITLTGSNTVTIANAVILAGQKTFSAGSGTFIITGSATDILTSTAASAVKLATNFTVSTATAAQAITLAALTQFKASGSTSAITTIVDTATAILALLPTVLAKAVNITLSGANSLSAAQAISLGTLAATYPLNALQAGATLVVSGTSAQLLNTGSDAALARTLAKTTGFTLIGASNTVDKAAGEALVVKAGFKLGAGSTLTVQDTATNLLAVNSALLNKGTAWVLSTTVSGLSIQNAIALVGRPGFSIASGQTIGVTGSITTLLASGAAAARAKASSFNVEGTITAAQAASVMTTIPTFTYSSGSRMSVVGSAADLKANIGSLGQANIVTLTVSSTVAIADAINLQALRGGGSFQRASTANLKLTGSATDILAANSGTKALATSFQVSGTVETAQATSLAALSNFTVAGGSIMNVIGSASALVAIATDLDKANSVTVTGDNTVSLADAKILVSKHNFSVASGATFGITGTWAQTAPATDLDNAGNVRAVAAATSITVTGSLTIAQATLLEALNPFATYTMTISDTAANILATGGVAVASKASAVLLSGDASGSSDFVTVAGAISLTGLNGFSRNAKALEIKDTAANILATGAATATARGVATIVTVADPLSGDNIVNISQLTTLAGLATFTHATGAHLEVQDSAANLNGYSGDLTSAGKATKVTVTGDNTVTTTVAIALKTFVPLLKTEWVRALAR